MSKLISKIISVVLIFTFLIPVSTVRIDAIEAEPNAIIYCEVSKGKHMMDCFGSGDIYDEGGDNRRFSGFRYYKCACGHVIFCSNMPESNNNIPGTYIESHTRMENLYDGYIIYKIGHTKGKIGTNLPSYEKTTSMQSCTFVY